MSQLLFATSMLMMLLLATPASANENPIRKTYPYSIVEVLIDKPKDESVQLARPLPLDKIPFKQRTDKYISIGTAWFSSEKQLFSAAHVFSPDALPYTTNFYVRNLAGEVFPIDRVNIYSNKYDVIAFTLKTYPAKIVPIAISRTFAMGDDVCAPGNALGEGISLRCGGQISSLNPEPQNGEWKEVYFSTPVSPGNPGGPLLDKNGKAIGIVIRKIKGEDLDIAIPFNELKKVKSKLEFFAKDMGYQDHEIQALKARQDMRIANNQPMPIMDWMKLIVDGVDAHMLRMNKLYAGLWNKSSILMNKNARQYFMNPSKAAYFSQIKFTPGQNSIEADVGKMQEIKNLKRPLFLQSIGNALYLMVESVKGEKAGALLNKPKEIMDTLLASGVFLKRKIADEEILYTSLGEPYVSLPVSDVLGRNWTLFRWAVKEIQADFSLFCTARPSGVACFLDQNAAMQSSESVAATFQINAAELTLGYYGNTRQWLEFMALPTSVKPKFMTDLKVTAVDGKIFVLSDDISLSAPLNSREKDDLVLSYSYDVQNPLKPVLFAASYIPNAKENMLVTTSRIYKGKTPEDRKSFASLNSGEKPFDGKMYQTKEGGFMTSEVVAKIDENCLILGFVAGEDDKKLDRFKCAISFEDEELAH